MQRVAKMIFFRTSSTFIQRGLPGWINTKNTEKCSFATSCKMSYIKEANTLKAYLPSSCSICWPLVDGSGSGTSWCCCPLNDGCIVSSFPSDRRFFVFGLLLWLINPRHDSQILIDSSISCVYPMEWILSINLNDMPRRLWRSEMEILSSWINSRV